MIKILNDESKGFVYFSVDIGSVYDNTNHYGSTAGKKFLVLKVGGNRLNTIFAGRQ